MAEPEWWARCYTNGGIAHNLSIEVYHKIAKSILKPRDRIDTAMLGLQEINLYYQRKELNIRYEIRSAYAVSTLHRDFKKFHPKCAKNYTVVSVEGSGFKIIKKVLDQSGTEITVAYFVKKNNIQCNREICAVRCPDCPRESPCAHRFTCECPAYGYRNICKHLHILAMSICSAPPNEDHTYATFNIKEVMQGKPIAPTNKIRPEELPNPVRLFF